MDAEAAASEAAPGGLGFSLQHSPVSLFKIIGEHGVWASLDAPGKRAWRLVCKEVGAC